METSVTAEQHWSAQRPHPGLANSKLLIIEKAGRFPWLEEPDAFFAGIRAFLPTLLTYGRYEVTPEEMLYNHSLVPGAEMAIFENSAHMAHLEETERFTQVVRDFLKHAESRQAARGL